MVFVLQYAFCCYVLVSLPLGCVTCLFSLSLFQLSHHPRVPEEHLGHLYNEPSSANPGYRYNTWIHSSYLPPNPNHMKLVIGSISQPSVSQSNHDQVHVKGRDN